jgi:hypothetical protein
MRTYAVTTTVESFTSKRLRSSSAIDNQSQLEISVSGFE